MLAKLTAKNQLTLPKAATDALGPVAYFDVQVQGGQIVLTPVRIQRGDAVRAKLAALGLAPDAAEVATRHARGEDSPSARPPAAVAAADATPATPKRSAKTGTRQAAPATKVTKAVTKAAQSAIQNTAKDATKNATKSVAKSAATKAAAPTETPAATQVTPADAPVKTRSRPKATTVSRAKPVSARRSRTEGA